ncbi:oligosaccharide flippase family protein [Enterococcus cecorum]|uniref:Uncharacterized protein n=1 Tax=Enterococcus cecorum DSM 20682 = ATCC 43198 TaxID=1121864 RepID=S1QUT6_9ENTE|nr:oligosaccharide flippase family protein [Enterococcus cecorum]EOX17526.1 hypothetical protein I567_01470 [Enterococcus cecorum DSM 20682 = ATCC 43198]ESK60695.1 hypothetical protein OMO_02358 [Enterococcus cecorum DSM 20682 = ATCC 43198]CAI3398047.1 oligosaccharide flippase family protein [Enterococcus cecorum DSM 20682 = ATCC 43198]SQE54289.1 Polysaccharide biosynthesis protein [Enterococcus cecorum]
MNFFRIILNKYCGLSLPTKSAIWFTICNLLLKGISFISVPLFTRLLSASEYGQVSLFLSYGQIILIFATWEIHLGAYQKGIFNYKEDLKFFTSSTQLLINILTIIFMSILFLFHNIVFKITDMNYGILIFLFLNLLTIPSYNSWLILKRTRYEYQKSVVATILYSLISVFAPLLGIVFIERSANIYYISLLFSTFIFCLFFYVQNINYYPLFKKIKKTLSQWNFLIKFEAPLVVHSLSYLVLSQADRIMIGNMVGKPQAGYYSIAYSIGNVITIFQTSLNQTLIPWRYQMLESKNYESIRKVTNYLLFIFAVLIVLFVLISPELMLFLFSKEYSDSIWSVPPISLSVYFMFLYTIFVNIETYFEKTQYVMYVSVFCAMVNILLNYFAIPVFGYIACGYTTVISYILFSIGHYVFMNLIIKKKLGNVKVFDVNIIIFISLFLVISVLIVTFLYKYITIRYILLFTLLILGVLNRDKVFNVIKIVRN